MTPTQRSLAKLRKESWHVWIVEKWIPATPAGFRGPIKRSDLMGFADLLAVRGNEVLLVQTTSGSNVSARIKKINDLPASHMWRESPTRKIVVHGWRKVGERGKRKLWACREEAL